MTDKIKKLEQLNEDVQPEFPTSTRGGYVEDTVDEWLTNHLREVNEIIKYQNYGVDLVEGLENELASAKEYIAELEANNADAPAPSPAAVDLDAVVDAGEADALRAELAAVRAELASSQAELAGAAARIEELENNDSSVFTFPTHESETVQASILLQHATRLGSEYIEKAKEDGEQIRRDAEATVVELRHEIEELQAQRFATYRSLEDFFSQELVNLRTNALFAAEAAATEEAEETVTDEEEVAAPAPEEDAAPAEEPAEEDAVSLEEDEDEDLSVDDSDDDELETSELTEEDEDLDGPTK